MNLCDLFAAHRATEGSALIDLSPADGSRRLTYADFDARLARVAGGLEEAGVAGGERVGILARNRGEVLELVFGALRVGVAAGRVRRR